jgi:hypothetical protein
MLTPTTREGCGASGPRGAPGRIMSITHKVRNIYLFYCVCVILWYIRFRYEDTNC